MITSIKYSSIQNKTPVELVDFILEKEKHTLKEVQVKDLIDVKMMNAFINDIYYNDIFIRGIYLFFDEQNRIRYVGKSKNGFYGRLMSQMDTQHRPFWGWNVILLKLGVERTSILHNELNDKEHEISLKTLLMYRIVIIEASKEEINEQQLGWLEKIVMKVFKESPEEKLLNTRVGRLSQQEKLSKIKNLI